MLQKRKKSTLFLITSNPTRYNGSGKDQGTVALFCSVNGTDNHIWSDYEEMCILILSLILSKAQDF